MRTITQHSKKVRRRVLPRSRGFACHAKRKGWLPASFEEHGGHGANAARSYRADVLHHVARLAGARSGAVASSAVSQGLTTTSIWPRIPDAAFALANVGFMPTADVLKAGPQATSGQAVLFARETRSTLSVRHTDASPPIRLELRGIIAEEWPKTKSETATQGRGCRR